MEIISAFSALIAMMVALLSTNLIVNTLVAHPSDGRFLTIDSLRGYLAFFCISPPLLYMVLLFAIRRLGTAFL
ncbi:hypothetical protein D3C77_679110 [compost metagenome]